MLDEESLRLTGKLTLTFINSGNRTVAVKDIYLNVIQPPLEQGKASTNCGLGTEEILSADSSLGPAPTLDAKKGSPKAKNTKRDDIGGDAVAKLRYAFEPFSLKAGEIAIKALNLEDGRPALRDKNKTNAIPVVELNLGDSGGVIVCVAIEGVGADSSNFVANVMLREDTWTKDGNYQRGKSATYNSAKPYTIYENRRTILFER